MTGIWTTPTHFRRAAAADIPAIMEIERQPGFESLVGRWSEEQHRVNIATPGMLYLVQDGISGWPQAFAALSGIGTAKGEVLLNRIIVKTPEIGTGKAFLRAVMKAAFEGAPTLRMWLRVRPSNERACHVYRSLGFKEDGVLSHAGRLPDGTAVDLMVMSIMYEDWAAQNPQ